MAIDFKSITLEVIDLSFNATPDIFINRHGITFSRRVLEDMNYPQNVQYCIDSTQKIFAIRVCKGNEVKASTFSKPKSEQTSTLATSNKNLREVISTLIPDYNPKKRYKVTGEYDAENRVMYFDMATAKESDYRSSTGEENNL